MYILLFMYYVHTKQWKNRLFTDSFVELLISNYYAWSGGDTFLLIHITI